MFKIDRFRSFLSLLGITIGVFMTLLVFTVVEGLQSSIRASLRSFGERVVFVQALPWTNADDFPWWEFLRRPRVQKSEATYLKEHLVSAQGVAYVQTFSASLRYKSQALTTWITTASADWFRLLDYGLSQGRSFSETECLQGAPIAILGSAVAARLLGEELDLGASLRIDQQEVKLVGILQPQGASPLSWIELDEAVIVPSGLALKLGQPEDGGYIVTAPKKSYSEQVFDAELRSLLRVKRRLSPVQPDNFAINRLDYLLSTVEELFRQLHLFGWVIGGFSLLIGGFGIANILLVAVRDRTPEIGVRMALGATPRHIECLFFIEAAALSILGACVGIVLAAALIYVIRDNGVIPLQINLIHVLECLGIALSIGLLAGWLPARQAAALDPAQAMVLK